MGFSMTGAFRRLLHAIDNHGPRETLLRALRRLVRKPQPAPPVREPEGPHPFDLLHGTDTGGYIAGEHLGSRSVAEFYATAYYAISPSSLTHALQLLPEPIAGFNFVDLGCGKGRALLVAAQFPFAQIAGVELSAELCAAARANTSAEPRIAVHHQDAATFTYPDGPLLVYMYHPFLKRVLRRVLANLERQRRGSAHPTYLLYANCTYDDLMARSAFRIVVWDYRIPLSAEDAAAHRWDTKDERYTLFKSGK